MTNKVESQAQMIEVAATSKVEVEVEEKISFEKTQTTEEKVTISTQ